MIPKPPLITLLIVRSAASDPSSAIVKVLVAPSDTGQEIVGPFVPAPGTSFTVTLPPSVNAVEELVMDDEADAPHSNTTLVGDPNVNEDKSSVDPARTDNTPVIVVLAPSVTVLPGLLIVRLALFVEVSPLPTS